MPAVPSWVIDPPWDQFQSLIPPIVDTHPLGCHNPRIPDRIVFDKLLQVLVLGASYTKIADTTCSVTTIRTRRDEWIEAGIFAALEQICLDAYDQITGLDLSDVTVDGCIVKAPCGGEAAGRSPVDTRQIRHETLPARRRGRGPDRVRDRRSPDQITVHLDAGYDSGKTRALLTELGCDSVISRKGFPLQAGKRRVIERTNSWHTRGFKQLAICTERRTRVIDAFIALANTIIIIRRLIRTAWTTHRWDNRPTHRP